MKLKLQNKFSVAELRDMVRDREPVKIEMTQEQFDWYCAIIKQRVFSRPPKFFGVPIEII